MEVKEVEAAKAHELFKDNVKIRLVLFEDKSISLCTVKDDKAEEISCYFIEPKEGNEKFYYMIQAFYSDIGFKVKEIDTQSE
jgi:hypothetical protein